MNGLWKDEHEWWCSLLKWYVRSSTRQVVPHICFLESQELRCYRNLLLCICFFDCHHVVLRFFGRRSHMIQIKSEKVEL
jgi:hypothetical protein